MVNRSTLSEFSVGRIQKNNNCTSELYLPRTSRHFIIPLAQRSCRGYIGFTPSVWHTCASALSGWSSLSSPIQTCIMLWVCSYWETSIRPASRVRSVAPTVLVGSISYLYILSSNFRRCVMCKVSCKISKFKFFAIFLNLWLCQVFWLGIWCESLVWVIMGWLGGISERRCSSCSSLDKCWCHVSRPKDKCLSNVTTTSDNETHVSHTQTANCICLSKLFSMVCSRLC